jgi:hypothetical protein
VRDTVAPNRKPQQSCETDEVTANAKLYMDVNMLEKGFSCEVAKWKIKGAEQYSFTL